MVSFVGHALSHHTLTFFDLPSHVCVLLSHVFASITHTDELKEQDIADLGHPPGITIHNIRQLVPRVQGTYTIVGSYDVDNELIDRALDDAARYRGGRLFISREEEQADDAPPEKTMFAQSSSGESLETTAAFISLRYMLDTQMIV